MEQNPYQPPSDCGPVPIGSARSPTYWSFTRSLFLLFGILFGALLILLFVVVLFGGEYGSRSRTARHLAHYRIGFDTTRRTETTK